MFEQAFNKVPLWPFHSIHWHHNESSLIEPLVECRAPSDAFVSYIFLCEETVQGEGSVFVLGCSRKTSTVTQEKGFIIDQNSRERN